MAETNKWALLTQALGHGVDAYNQDRAHRRQSRQLRHGLTQQQARQSEADASLGDLMSAMEGSGPADDRASLNDAYMQQLMRTRRMQTGAIPTLDGASSRYAADAAGASTDIGQYGARLSDIMARADAPILQRQGEQQLMARTASDIQGVARGAQSDDFLTRLRASQMRPNPWVAFMADLAARAGANWPGEDGDGRRQRVRHRDQFDRFGTYQDVSTTPADGTVRYS